MIQLETAYSNLIRLIKICANVRKYLHSKSKPNLIKESESKFKVLDTALANWFNNLPDWLRFENFIDRNSLINGVGNKF